MTHKNEGMLEVMSALVSALATTAQVSKSTESLTSMSARLAENAITPEEVLAWKAATAALQQARLAHEPVCEGFVSIARPQ